MGGTKSSRNSSTIAMAHAISSRSCRAWMSTCAVPRPRVPPCEATVIPAERLLAQEAESAIPVLLLLLIEIGQVRRRLVWARGHQLAIRAQEVRIVADLDHGVIVGADVGPPERTLRIAGGLPPDRPRPRQRVVEDRNVVIDDVRVGRIEIEALLDDGFTVAVERNAARVVGARAFQEPRLDFQDVVFAVAVLVDPFADRV